MRALKAEEIQCRAQIVKQNGFSLLLYKDARCDMQILDETYGEMNWQRKHKEIGGKIFCALEVWDEDKNQWVTKEDIGSESMMEAEKGQSSDSFKRAGFNWAIGRELYTAPFIWINAKAGEVYKRKDGKFALDNKAHFTVQDIVTEDGIIQDLTIIDQDLTERWKMGRGSVDAEKDWLDETKKDKWMKAEEWVKEGNNPHKLRKKYKVSSANMDYFRQLYEEATAQ